ncbi:hypothetical protein H6F61_08450 [Cyanobacteria bacterium FACHB-472]|nr:hypothetical protein [Cyanobacteria bacterium FACHB-472]
MSRIHGTPKDDYIEATEGDDVIFGYAGDDTLVGKEGNDIIHGGLGNDLIQGGEGEDTLFGEDGDDCLLGGEKRDRLFGGDGDDTLIGGKNSDRLFGGRGNDIYVYSPGDGFDTIEDESGTDILRLKHILSNEVSVDFAIGGWLCVSYRDQPIVKMRGVEFIHTEDGCFTVAQWLKR